MCTLCEYRTGPECYYQDEMTQEAVVSRQITHHMMVSTPCDSFCLYMCVCKQGQYSLDVHVLCIWKQSRVLLPGRADRRGSFVSANLTTHAGEHTVRLFLSWRHDACLTLPSLFFSSYINRSVSISSCICAALMRNKHLLMTQPST